MIFVGLDLSLRKTGWALRGNGQSLTYGVIQNCPYKGVRRLAWLLDELKEVLPKDVPFTAAVEGYSMGSRGLVFDIGEWGGIVKLHLYARGSVVCLLVPPKTLKMHVTSDGNASKERVIKATNRLLNTNTQNDNEADALALLRVAEHWYTKPQLTEYETRAMKKIKPCYPIPFSPNAGGIRTRIRTRCAKT